MSLHRTFTLLSSWRSSGDSLLIRFATQMIILGFLVSSHHHCPALQLQQSRSPGHHHSSIRRWVLGGRRWVGSSAAHLWVQTGAPHNISQTRTPTSLMKKLNTAPPWLRPNWNCNTKVVNRDPCSSVWCLGHSLKINCSRHSNTHQLVIFSNNSLHAVSLFLP